jgi:hypothetical protein
MSLSCSGRSGKNYRKNRHWEERLANWPEIGKVGGGGGGRVTTFEKKQNGLKVCCHPVYLDPEIRAIIVTVLSWMDCHLVAQYHGLNPSEAAEM